MPAGLGSFVAVIKSFLSSPRLARNSEDTTTTTKLTTTEAAFQRRAPAGAADFEVSLIEDQGVPLLPNLFRTKAPASLSGFGTRKTHSAAGTPNAAPKLPYVVASLAFAAPQEDSKIKASAGPTDMLNTLTFNPFQLQPCYSFFFGFPLSSNCIHSFC